MSQTINKVPRELLEVIEQTWRIHYQGGPVTNDLAAEEIEKGLGQLRAILAAPPEKVRAWPVGRDIGRYGDMSPSGHMRVGFDSDNDVYVSVWDEDGGASVEFCCPGSGGGRSPRTREALINLMLAMEADNVTASDKDWWAKRMAVPAAPAKEARE